MSKADNPRAVPGDNSKDEAAVAGDRVRAFVERVERIESEMDERKADRAEIYAEAKGQGFNVRAIRELVRARKEDKAAREERMTMFRLYAEAIGFNAFD